MQDTMRLPRNLKIGLKQDGINCRRISMAEEVAETAHSVKEHKRLFGQWGRTHSWDGLGHALKKSRMPSCHVADLILKAGGDQAQKFLDRTVSIVNLKSYALNVTHVADVEALCPFFDVNKDSVDNCELRDNA